MRKALQNLLDECSGKGPATECPILESLESEQPMIDKQTKSKPKGVGLWVQKGKSKFLALGVRHVRRQSSLWTALLVLPVT
jgi:lipoate-protein ligase B